MNEREAEQMIEESQKEMLAMKEKMDNDRYKQEQDLHKKLSKLKAKRLEEQAKKQQKELKELDKKIAETQTKDGYVGKFYKEFCCPKLKCEPLFCCLETSILIKINTSCTC